MAAVDVLALDLADLDAETLLRLASLLDESERARAARFMFENDRTAFIAAHGLLRLALSARSGEEARNWRFATASRGKPYLEQAPRDMRFSLSHTRGMVAVAVSEGVEIGVDVEEPRGAREPMKLARRFFAPAEIDALAAINDADAQRDAFLKIWTVKESVVKATGQGLACALDSFTVILEPLAIAMEPGAGQPFSAGHWRRGGFHVALALQRPDVSETLTLCDAAALIRTAR